MVRRKAKKESFFVPILIGLLIVIGFGFTYKHFENKIEVNQRTGCPISNVDQRSALSLLLDSSEPYTPVQMSNIVNRIQNKVNSLKSYDHLRIYTIGVAEEELLVPHFDFCKPDPESAESPLMRNWKAGNFEQRLRDTLGLMQGSRDNSHIITSIGSVASELPDSYDERTIIIVSDLVENSNIGSMYSPNWQEALSERNALLDARRPMLGGIRIEILFAPRANAGIDFRRVRDWWMTFLSDSGGMVARIDPISG
jgi:hypothetical protein